MDWIKKNYDQFALVILAVALLASSVMLGYTALNFKGIFASLQQPVVHNNNVPGQPTDALENARTSLQKPALWTPQNDAGSLFVSERYLVQEGKLIPLADPKRPLHPPIPNKWFLDNNLDIQDPDILNQDPQHKGFSILDDWKAGTDPNDPKSHPPYITKLRLEKYIQKPFRLKLEAYDGDLAKPDTLEFQINTVDVTQPSQFRKLGDAIEGTKFVVEKFEHKSHVDANDIEEDDSELTVKNTEDGKEVVLIYQKVVNSPDSYALLKYLWNGDQITVKKYKTFNLKPTNEEYKLIDISDAEALIENPKGEKIKIPRLEVP